MNLACSGILEKCFVDSTLHRLLYIKQAAQYKETGYKNSLLRVFLMSPQRQKQTMLREQLLLSLPFGYKFNRRSLLPALYRNAVLYKRCRSTVVTDVIQLSYPGPFYYQQRLIQRIKEMCELYLPVYNFSYSTAILYNFLLLSMHNTSLQYCKWNGITVPTTRLITSQYT